MQGSGSQVLSSPQGIALDGENLTNNNDPNSGVQLPLPSGDGYPGGNFYDNFIINTTPPIVTKGTFQLDPTSDSNIVGDFVTFTNSPSFIGSITEPNPVLVPLAGQTAIVDIGIAARDANGVLVDYFDPASTPSFLLPYLRPNAGTSLTDVNGNFVVSVGIDGAGTGIVTNTNPLLDSPYSVGSSGKLTPLPGTVNGFYVARARVIDQSGNSSNPGDPNSMANFVVDTVNPTVTVTSPTPNSVITTPSGPQVFTVQTSENMDLTHFTTSQIQLLQSAPNGSFTGTGVTTIPINSNISVLFQDATANGGTGLGQGREQITFQTQNTLPNGLYQLTLVGSGGNAIRDIAGNTPAGGDIVVQFAVFNPNNITGVFVGPASLRHRHDQAGRRPRQPIPDDHRRPRCRHGRRAAGGSARRLYRADHSPALRQPGLGRPDEHQHQLRRRATP